MGGDDPFGGLPVDGEVVLAPQPVVVADPLECKERLCSSEGMSPG